MKTFVIGDIHGAHMALEQCLERSEFNRAKDTLITLGDVCDGWPYVFECVETLLTLQQRIDIIGNHDEWFKRWLTTGSHPDQWTQGGKGTYRSYSRNLNGYDDARHYLNPGDIPGSHWKFFMHQNLYYTDDQRNAFFVHGGFDRWKSIDENRTDNETNFYWDRDLWDQAKSVRGSRLAPDGKGVKLKTVDDFDSVYIGHTALRGTLPIYSGGVWNLDTGAGWNGKLTIMDIDTNKYWQSDLVPSLYPDEFAKR